MVLSNCYFFQYCNFDIGPSLLLLFNMLHFVSKFSLLLFFISLSNVIALLNIAIAIVVTFFAISIRRAMQKKNHMPIPKMMKRGSEQQLLLSLSWKSNNLIMGSNRESTQTIILDFESINNIFAGCRL